MSTQPRSRLSAPKAASSMRDSRAMRWWCCQAWCWRRALHRSCNSGSASCAAANLVRLAVSRSSVATKKALRSSARRWGISEGSSASANASTTPAAATLGVLLVSPPSALAQASQRSRAPGANKASSGEANPCQRGNSAPNACTDASTTPAASASANSTRFCSAFSSAFRVWWRPCWATLSIKSCRSSGLAARAA